MRSPVCSNRSEQTHQRQHAHRQRARSRRGACWRSRPVASAYAHDEVGALSLLSKSSQTEKFELLGRLVSFDPYGPMMRRDDSALKLVVTGDSP